MIASIYRETLEKFYHRAYGDQRMLRLGSVAMVAALTAYTGVWSTIWALVWVTAYVASEFSLVVWWRVVQPRLRAADMAGISRLQSELITICAISCGICTVPALVTPFSVHDNQIVGAMLSATILLVAGAEHSLRKSMFLWTAPPAGLSSA